ncbi:nucleoside diphosphate-linked moiety X motif 8-like [Amphibalanus amphitrite]|uniref:nucleoside diphosphate-linked moiety X motif 8-like n=1 Tax=Amphibalanus amphitrite TaxID=1232801 RepID=UPI001C91F19B|nr:nucleoside diphosphate-linked moiety X motif 8-like [Amphibalanus amphitrite]
MLLRSAARLAAPCRPLTVASPVPPPALTDAVLTPERREAFVSRLSKVRLPVRTTDGEPGAAVLAPLCRVDGRPGLLYTLRSSALNKHAGEVAFPGGNRDRQDADTLATALRETEEEIGLHVERDQLWGVLPSLLSRFGGKPVAAYVADVGEVRMEDLRPQPDEVEDVFFLSLEHLCKPQNAGHTQWRRRDAGYSLPVFLNGPHRVWGLTGIFTHILLGTLLPEWYKHKVPYLRPVRERDSERDSRSGSY